MSKIFFKTGVMGSGKTFDLLRVIYNYKEKGLNTLVYKPRLDTRDGVDKCVISTRANLEDAEAKWVPDDLYLEVLKDIGEVEPHAIIVDESQFLTKNQIDIFQKICYNYNMPVIFYGLKTTFQGELFEGSKRILEICDDVEEFKSMCHCGKVARQNVRLVDGKMVTDGDIVSVGGNEMYTAVCNHCFVKRRVK